MFLASAVTVPPAAPTASGTVNRRLCELGTQGVWEYDLFQQRRHYCPTLILFIPLFAFLW